LSTPGGTSSPTPYSLTTSAGSATASPSSVSLPVNTHYNNATGVVLNSAGTVAYITNAGTTGNTNTRSKVVQCDISNGQFSKCAISTGATGFTAPKGITLNSAGTKQYLAVYGPSNNKAFQCVVDGAGDLSSCLSAYTIGGRNMVDIKLTSNDAYAYLSSDNYQSVYQCSVDGTTGVLTCNTVTPAVGSGSGGMCVPEMMTVVGTKLYIASQLYTDNEEPQNSCNDAVTYCTIDNSTGAVSSCINANVSGLDQPFGIALNPTNTFAYITNWNTNTVKCAVSSTDGSLSSCGPSGAGSGNGITLNSSGTQAYIVNNNKVQICAVDGSTGALSSCNNYY
jgi:DNA-binding beta-propeller fold protein YncE